ncbi:MAG: hypothetical protein LBD02_08915 [Christensenellaceae bacterium]|jgi:predicted phage-related endonuclease|nr:hypothetical protein [Christensenellaceae bacterium]
MSINELGAQVKELKELKRMAEELAAEISAVEDGIKAEMEARQTDELHVGMWKVTWKAVTSTRLDQAAVRARAPELCERYTKTITTRRFIVA